MFFPTASETFTSSRLRTLSALGHRMRVFALRAAPGGGEKLARERAVDSIPTSHNGVVSSLRGIVAAVKRPVLLSDTLRWLFGATKNSRSQLARALAILPRSFDILDRLEHDPPDVLHTEWGHYPTVVARLVQRRLPGVVVSISLIAYDLTAEFGATIDVVRDAEVVRTQAKTNVALISRFAGVPAERVSVVHDGVEFARIRRAYGREPKIAGRCVVAARLVPEKGVDDAIRVFALAKARVDKATLRVLGEGPDLGRLQRLARSLGVERSVEFLGHVSHERVIEEFAVAEILLHMSHHERLPNVVKEAMACRCACITTRTIGIEELIQDGVTGFIVEQRAVEPAAAAAISLLEGTTSPAAMGDAAFEFISKEFDHEHNVLQLVDLWRRAALQP